MDLKQILLDQKAELNERMRETKIVERELLQNIKEVEKSQLVKVVTGVRRSGKSVLLSLLLNGKEYGYVNFDDEILANSNLNDIYSALLEIQGESLPILFFDEIQNVENWELFINRIHRAGHNIFITGSNAKLLSKELATHLTGRHIAVELYPFSFREYLNAVKFAENLNTTKGKALIKNHLAEYIKTGGFPEIILKKENPKIYLRELFRSVIDKDVITRYNIKYRATFKELALSLISEFSSSVSYNSLKKRFQLGSDHTAKNYLYYLTESYLLFFIDKFSFKPKEIKLSQKKVYAIDTGLINAVSLKFSEDSGKLMENLVAIELLRRRSYHNLDLQIFYWKDYQQNEVDFVVKEESEIKQLIQVTYASNIEEIGKRETNGLVKGSEALKCEDLLIITWDYEGDLKSEHRTIKFIPLWKWLVMFSSR